MQTNYVVSRQSTCSICMRLNVVHVPLYHFTPEILVLSTSCCGAVILCNHNDHGLGQACPVLQFCIIRKCSRVTLLHTKGRGAGSGDQKGLNTVGKARLSCSDEIVGQSCHTKAKAVVACKLPGARPGASVLSQRCWHAATDVVAEDSTNTVQPETENSKAWQAEPTTGSAAQHKPCYTDFTLRLTSVPSVKASFLIVVCC